MSFRVHSDIQVRFRDTDGMGHVNNAVYLSYFELARMEYWKALTGDADYSKVDFILVRAEVDYKSPLLVHETARVSVRASRVGRSSWDLEYRVTEGGSGRLVAEGRTVQCRFDYKTGKVRRVDPEMRERIEAFEGRTLAA